MQGVGMDGQRGSSAFPIIIDPNYKLNKAAENFSIPISGRLIYTLLSMLLLEEEGLMDNFVVENVNPGLMQMTPASLSQRRNVSGHR